MAREKEPEGEDAHPVSPASEDSGERPPVSLSDISKRMRPYGRVYMEGGRDALKAYIDDDGNRESLVDDMEFIITHAPALGEEIINTRRETKRLKRDNRKLERQTVQDHLTDLGNRRGFDQYMERLDAMYRDSFRGQTSLLMLDVDLFKEVNDTHGHIAGDAVLVAVADCIRNSIRGNDSAFKYGGEEFAVVLMDTDYEGAKTVGEHIRNTVESMESGYGLVTVSVGAATYDPAVDRYLGTGDLDGSGVEFFVDQADSALYRAKGPQEYRDRSHGRNRVVHFLDKGGDRNA